MGEEKYCISCGMPLRTPDDHPLGDTTKDYCKYCAKPDGSMKSFEEALSGMAGFLERSQGLKGEAAWKAAFFALTKNPASVDMCAC